MLRKTEYDTKCIFAGLNLLTYSTQHYERMLNVREEVTSTVTSEKATGKTVLLPDRFSLDICCGILHSQVSVPSK